MRRNRLSFEASLCSMMLVHICAHVYVGRATGRQKACVAHLVGDGVEQGGLVGGFEVFDRVVVFEHAMGGDGESGDTVWMVSWIDR